MELLAARRSEYLRKAMRQGIPSVERGRRNGGQEARFLLSASRPSAVDNQHLPAGFLDSSGARPHSP